MYISAIIAMLVDVPVSHLLPWYARNRRDIDTKARRAVRISGIYVGPIVNNYMDDINRELQDALYRVEKNDDDSPIMGGSIGLGLGMDLSSGCLYISVETAFMIHTAKTLPVKKPERMLRMGAWRMHECVWIISNGWIGCFAEYRLWTAMCFHLNYRLRDIQTLRPVAAQWYSSCLLEEILMLISPKCVKDIIDIMIAYKCCGMPDLMFCSKDTVYLFECKSSTDKLSYEQRDMQNLLNGISGVTASILYTENSHVKEHAYDTD